MMQPKLNNMNNKAIISKARKKFSKVEVIEFFGSTLHMTTWGETYRRRKFVFHGVNLQADLIDTDESREKLEPNGGRFRGYSTFY